MKDYPYNKNACRDIVAIHNEISERVKKRLQIFHRLWERGTEKEIFLELAFCLMTPQTKARQGEKAINILLEKDLVFRGDAGEIARHLNIVRFRNRKAEYLVAAREQFTDKGRIILKKTLREFADPKTMRKFLVSEVKGMGWKEASHFLRNIGLGRDLAILDRHILKNLLRAGCIDNVPESLTPPRYMLIEEKMADLAAALDIPLAGLDFVLWYMETGDIFK